TQAWGIYNSSQTFLPVHTPHPWAKRDSPHSGRHHQENQAPITGHLLGDIGAMRHSCTSHIANSAPYPLPHHGNYWPFCVHHSTAAQAFHSKRSHPRLGQTLQIRCCKAWTTRPTQAFHY